MTHSLSSADVSGVLGGESGPGGKLRGEGCGVLLEVARERDRLHRLHGRLWGNLRCLERQVADGEQRARRGNFHRAQLLWRPCTARHGGPRMRAMLVAQDCRTARPRCGRACHARATTPQ